jgi:ligand-binding sensor domain-containing protein
MHPIAPTRKMEYSRPPLCNILLLFSWMLICLGTKGQTIELPSFKQQVFNSSNGLSNSNIRVLAKDVTGYLWIGTANGLSRFDGHYFTNFFHIPGDSLSLGHNFIQGIICDDQAKIWVLHVLGLSLFDPETHYFSNFPVKQDYPHFSGSFFSFAADGEGNLWLGNQNGLAVFNTRERRYLTLSQLNTFLFRKDNGLAGTGINGMVRGEKGQMWFNTFNSLITRDPENRKTQEITLQGIGGQNGSIALQYADTIKKELYLGTFNKGLIRYHYPSGKWEQFGSGPASLSTTDYDPIRNLQPFGKGVDAYISELGIGFFNEVAGTLEQLKPFPLGKDQVMNCLFTDAKHIWAGTDNGLFLLTPEKIKLENITPVNRNEGAFNTVQVHPHQPILFSGNYAMPVMYQMPSSGGLKTDLKSITGFLRYFFKDGKGNEWLSTDTAIYHRVNQNGIWKKVPVALSGKETTQLLPRNFIEDGNGTIWVRIRNAGLYVFDIKKQAFVPHLLPELQANSIFSGLIFNPSTNTLWLSEEKTGLYALNLKTKKWEHNLLQLANTPLTPARIVSGKNGEIAFPDPFNGIGIYFPETKKIRLMSQKDGLLSNNVSSIQIDTQGNFWTFTTEGISKIMGGDFSVANFRHPELVKMQEIACGNDGMVYVAAAEGLYRFNGNLMIPAKASGKLLIHKVEVMGEAYPFGSTITLPPGKGDIQIYFSYIDLYSGQHPTFEYRFERDKEWKSLGERNTISFSRLSPGSYKLSIREKHENNPVQWKQLFWTIEKPYWQTNAFMAATLILTGLLVYFFTQRRITAIREKAALQQKMAETKMAALQAQMNPHFIFNAINCIDAMVQEGDKYNATTYLNKFARLLRNVLEGSRNATVSLSTDIETLRLYLELECMRMDQTFTWEIDLPDTVAAADIRVPSLIIQPYVENAILHGLRHLTDKKGELKVKVGLNNDILSYLITDNGVGRKFAKTIQKTQHTSFGLDITRERIEHFNLNNRGTVTITDLMNDKGEPEGTVVKVLLPLN